jgi:hypothetical protein
MYDIDQALARIVFAEKVHRISWHLFPGASLGVELRRHNRTSNGHNDNGATIPHTSSVNEAILIPA